MKGKEEFNSKGKRCKRLICEPSLKNKSFFNEFIPSECSFRVINKIMIRSNDLSKVILRYVFILCKKRHTNFIPEIVIFLRLDDKCALLKLDVLKLNKINSALEFSLLIIDQIVYYYN